MSVFITILSIVLLLIATNICSYQIGKTDAEISEIKTRIVILKLISKKIDAGCDLNFINGAHWVIDLWSDR